jgi:uncharacterized protein
MDNPKRKLSTSAMPIDYNSLEPAEHQRLPEYKRDDDWIKAFLQRSLIGHVAHTSGSQPFITPTNFWFDEADHRIIFHSNIAGRTRTNLENEPLVCFETSEFGRMLPSNAALEFSIQYRSVLAFGQTKLINDQIEKCRLLEKLIAKYFPGLRPGVEYRPITEKELGRTSVYEILINSWSGKENWQDQAEQITDWPPIPEVFR